jgi:hypothetical protein
LIDFDWIKGYLISGRVSLTFLKNWVGSGSGRVWVQTGQAGFSGRVLPSLSKGHA